MIDFPFPWKWKPERYTRSYAESGIDEKTIQSSCLAILNAQGVLAWAVDVGAKQLRGRAVAALRASGGNVGALVGRTGAGTKGFSDIVGVDRATGRAVFIEVKAPGKNPTEEQLSFLFAVRQAGACAGVVWAGLEVIPILAQGDKERDDY